MAKAKRSTKSEPNYPDTPDTELNMPDELQIEPRHWGTCYVGKRADILKAGILPADLLPKKFQDIEVVHDGHQIKGGKWGWGKWTRWELWVYHDRRAPTLTLIQGGNVASE